VELVCGGCGRSEVREKPREVVARRTCAIAVGVGGGTWSN
jgi:hypothetical protein